MPFAKVYLHFVWSTKKRYPFLDSLEIRKMVWQHIKENSFRKNIFIDSINGYREHCHCLVSMGVNHSISTVMQLIKGESSYWINQNKLCKEKFEWQSHYYVVSVGQDGLSRVRRYIRNQEQHHSVKLFEQEHAEFIKQFGFEKIEDS